MIKLGMTDCPPVRKLLDSGRLELDFVEVHGPFVENAREVLPDREMLLHNSLYQWSLAHPDGLAHMQADLYTRQRVEKARSAWYSLHLGFSCADVDFEDEAMQARSHLLPRDVVLSRSITVLNQLVETLNVPVLIENLDYNPTGAYEYVCEPTFIAGVIEQTPTFLLLDLAHARVTASAFGVDVRAYLQELPLNKVRQLHINRPGWQAGRLVDAHIDLEDEDYELLEWVLTKTNPLAITLEYNRAEDRIVEQIRRLRSIIAIDQSR